MERLDLSPVAGDKLKKHRAERRAASIVPAEAHLTETVVKTRDGALVAAFELAGTAFEAKSPERRDLYKEQLNVALRNVATPRLALWSCLIRRREEVDFRRAYPNAFAQRVADAYNALQRRRSLYRNRLLLFLVYRATALRTQSALAKKADKRLVREMLIAGIDALEDIAVKLAASLRDYGPRRLGLYRHAGNRFSEIAEGYSLLLNHTAQRVPVGPFDLAEAIAANRLLYGREAFEIRQPARSVYGAALSIKEYPERTYPEMFRSLLEVPFEIDWVQSFAFVEKEKARVLLVQQRNRLISSGDEAISQVDALDEALDDLIANRFVVGEHNATLAVYADGVAELIANLSKAQSALADPGCVAVREDLALEGQVHATLPGNAKYRARTAHITSLNFAAMSPFFDFPVGRPDGHHWGEALTLLRSTVDTPLWFSPHVEDVGHMSVLGMTGAGKTALLAFLLAQMQRFSARHVILDKDRGLKIAVLALGGQYKSLKTGEPTGFNPFALPYSPRHASYLQDLVKLLAGGEWSAKAEKEVEEGIAYLYESLSPENRRLDSLVHFLDTTESEGVAERLHRWVGQGRYAWAFDNAHDTLAMERLSGFDVTEFLELPELRTPITSYLLYRIEPLIDGSPFALWIDEFWRLLDDPFFEDFVRDRLKTVRKKNGIVVTSTQSPSDALKSSIAAAILEQTPTKIFLPNEYADESDYRGGLKLTAAEWGLFRRLSKSQRRFLLKQTGISALVDFDLSGMDEEMAVLSGTEKNVRIVEAIEAEHGGELPPDWLDLFHDRRKQA